MVQSIDNALITQFSAMVHEAAQQKMSRLRPYVKVEQMTGDLWAYDGLGTVEMRELAGRNPKVVFDDIDHLRRKVSRKRFAVALPIDASDIRGSLLGSTKYADAITAAAMRQTDRVIYNAAFADVYTGRDFGTTVTAATDGVTTVDATAGLTYEKLLEIKETFINNDVGTDAAERIYLTITGAEHTRLMREEQLTSGDFNRNYVVEKGVIVNALGIDLVAFAANAPSPVIPVASSQRQLIAASDRGIALGVSKEMSIKIQERNDLHETTQVLIEMEIGAVRTEGKLVQKVSVTA